MNSRFKILVWSLLLISLPGCGYLEWPPSGSSFSASSESQKSKKNDPLKMTVRKGDTVYGLAQRFGVSSKAVIAANNLRPPYHLRTGQTLVIPGMLHHVVEKGDTLYGIAQRYNMGTYALARFNNIPPPYILHEGQKIRIDRMAYSAPQVPGDRLRTTQLTSLQPETMSTAAGPVQSDAVAKKVASILKPPSLTGKGFSWPVRGKILSSYGAKQGGLHNDGINIEAPKGTSVRAIENGVVVYSGNELRGFGNLLLIRHDDNWVSAYAHNDALLVGRGHRITKGQVIAKVGNTGSVDTPQLHFELRQGNRTRDPLKHLL